MKRSQELLQVEVLYFGQDAVSGFFRNNVEFFEELKEFGYLDTTNKQQEVKLIGNNSK